MRTMTWKRHWGRIEPLELDLFLGPHFLYHGRRLQTRDAGTYLVGVCAGVILVRLFQLRFVGGIQSLSHQQKVLACMSYQTTLQTRLS